MDSELSEALRVLEQRRRVPTTTYRLQLHRDFTFRQAREILPYLERLGITDCYTSPVLKAAPGSQHGYDICDHRQLNPEIGSPMEYEAFAQELQRRHLGHLLDFVPNHMGVDADTNPWWRDVLENGPTSPYARFFDIEWDPIKPELKSKVLLPILGDQYGAVLERGELQLVFEQGRLLLKYHERKIPLNPHRTPQVLKHWLEGLQAELKDDPNLREFLSIMTELANLPSGTDHPEQIEERQREKEVARDRLERLVRVAPRIEKHILDAVKAYNGVPGKPETFNGLHQLLEAQNYRLAYWKTAMHEINYRRFFDVNQLAGIRMETREVFIETHRLVLELLGEEKITALRLDHPDGLYDPAAYFDTLQEAFVDAWAARRLGRELSVDEQSALRLWRRAGIKEDPKGIAARPLYLAAEKILSTSETLPSTWSLNGSSGYDFLNDLNRLFVQPASHARFKELYGKFTGKRAPLDVVIYVSKRLIMTTSMASELNVLAHTLNRISEENRRSRDFTLDSLRDALREVVACFPVYRTYIGSEGCTQSDRQLIDRAIAKARRRNPAMESSIFQFVREVLIPFDAPELPPEQFQRRLAFSMKFQQYTGPVMAKGLEDTAFYRYNMLLSLNEVGGDPHRFGSSVKEFHETNQRRYQEWRYSMLASATHDTKRGEDARARLNVLSEMPEEWQSWIGAWSQATAAAKTSMENDVMPEANDEYLFYQTLLGAWPIDAAPGFRESLTERLRAYMQKAIKEAKLRTSWVTPSEDYEKAVDRFVQETLLGDASSSFLKLFEPAVRIIAGKGVVNSLAQLILKSCSPGVPDFYQGTELWELSLVDPDNRQAVDYADRQKRLEDIERVLALPPERLSERMEAIAAWLENWPSGQVKFFVTAATLRFRRARAALFADGAYVPLEVSGAHADHVMSFARQQKEETVVVIVPRLCAQLGGERHFPLGVQAWGDTRVILPPGCENTRFREILSGAGMSADARPPAATIAVGDALKVLPVAILEKEALG